MVQDIFQGRPSQAGVQFTRVQAEPDRVRDPAGDPLLHLEGAAAHKRGEMEIRRPRQRLPGNISFLEVVVGIGGHQDGALTFPVGQDIGPAALPLGGHVGQVHPGETFLQEFSVGIMAHPAHQPHRQAQAGQGIGGVGRHTAAPAPRRPAVPGQQGRQARLILPGDGLLTTPAEAGAPVLKETFQVIHLKFQVDIDGAQAHDRRPHAWKINSICGSGQGEGPHRAWGFRLKPGIFWVITPCNPWIFS